MNTVDSYDRATRLLNKAKAIMLQLSCGHPNWTAKAQVETTINDALEQWKEFGDYQLFIPQLRKKKNKK